MSNAIPIAYLAVFTIFDFLLPLGGIYLHLVNPSVVLSGFTPMPAQSISPELRVLLDAMAGWFAGLVFLHLYLRLKRPADIPLWRAIQFSLVLVDIFQLVGFGRELSNQSRTSIDSWRPEDWQNVAGYSILTVVRLSFATGVGLGQASIIDEKKTG